MQNLDVHIRPARREDIPCMVEISLSSVSKEEVEGFGVPIEDSLLGNPQRASAAWTEPNYMGTEEVIVAEIDGRVVGHTMLEDRGDALELVDIDVLRRLQGRGIGTQLVRFVEKLAMDRGKNSVTLGTSRNSEGEPWKSLPWWQSQGYRITHEEENEWTRSIGPGAREIRMCKDLRG